MGLLTPTMETRVFEMKMTLAEDRKTAEVTLPGMTAPLVLSADDMSEIIRHLAWLRASMEPAHPAVDLTPGTLTSVVPAIRWQATEDEIPGQARLYLLHPGFGWLHIPLHRPAFDDMSAKLRLFLQARPAMQ
jgi:hypothetical protein